MYYMGCSRIHTNPVRMIRNNAKQNSLNMNIYLYVYFSLPSMFCITIAIMVGMVGYPMPQNQSDAVVSSSIKMVIFGKIRINFKIVSHSFANCKICRNRWNKAND